MYRYVDYDKIIENQKNIFLNRDKKEDTEGSLPMNYSKLHTALLMNIIESRQKILIQRLEFDDDFNKTFPADNNTDANNQNISDHDDNNDETLTTIIS
ncbi:unnamed protein product [Rotaria sp. Silwood2]|nr:unnamed protein product [Rotaria sp. Silwood2]CAF3034486.1 unnamed protein product [Rotaria sp. Silwood2]CAF3242911.1 unnamed protein product [Rotaria sp. Silwood2]CAF4586201.1 unnamed protein product [Rotaria sp. Silwood2]CAF4620603.1 unnamed protein product [Rotaria sp. Silwood2]